MATTPTYEAVNGLSLPGPNATDATIKPRLRDHNGALTDAIRAHDESICKSRAVTAAAFFVTTALAVAMQDASATPMLGMLGLSLVNAGLTGPLARSQFRSEIERRARAEGFSKSTGSEIASNMLAEWSNSPENWVTPPVAED